MPRERRIRAALALILWIAGFELLPGMHVGLHDALPEHEHGEHGRSRVTTGPGSRALEPIASHGHAHEHGHEHAPDNGAAHSAAHEHRAAAPVSLSLAAGTDRYAGAESRHGHGAHSLAHRGIAAAAPVPAIPPLLPAPAVASPRLDDVVATPPLIARARPRQRGPPA